MPVKTARDSGLRRELRELQESNKALDGPKAPTPANIIQGESAFLNVIKEANAHMSCVTRLVDPRSPEARCERAQEAYRDEMAKQKKYDTLEWSSVNEWEDVAREDPRATVVKLKLVLSSTFEDRPELQKYKARGVLESNLQRDVDGRIVRLVEPGMAVDPMTFDEMRSVTVAGLLEEDGTLEQGDAEAAYLKAMMMGDSVWVRPRRDQWPEDWRGKYKDPVVRANRAIYGAQRAGFDFDKHRTTQLGKVGYKLVPGSLSIYKKKTKHGTYTLGTFVDDFLLGGPRVGMAEEWRLIDGVLPLKGQPGPPTVCLGVDVRVLTGRDDTLQPEARKGGSYAAAGQHKKIVQLSQKQYAQYCLETFQKDTGKKMRAVSTPAVKEGEREELRQPGQYAHIAKKHIGSLMYLARGSRPDIMFAVSWLSRGADRWCVEHDFALLRLYRYLSGTLNFAIELVVDERDAGKLCELSYSDTDHAGDREQRKSTTGGDLFVTGPHGTYALLGFLSKLQKAVALSSGEAESSGAAYVVQKMLLPANRGALSEHISEVEHCLDATTAEAALRKGYSREMAHMSVTQGVRLSWVHHVLFKVLSAKLSKVGTDKNVADIHTKPTDYPTFVRLCKMLGMVKAC